MPSSTGFRASAIVATSLLAYGSVDAITSGSVEVGRIDGAGWFATGISLRLALDARSAVANVQRVRFVTDSGSVLRELTDLRIECGSVVMDIEIVCTRARVTGALADLGKQTLQGDLRFDRRNGALKFAVRGLSVAKGIASLNGEWRDRWTANIKLQAADANAVRALLEKFLPQVSDLTVSGRIDADVGIDGRASNIERLDWRIDANDLTANNAGGTLAAEKLQLASAGSMRRVRGPQGQEWSFETRLTARGGQAFAEPIFIDLAEHPFSLSTTGTWRDKTIDIRSFTLEQPSVAMATGRMKLALGEPFRVDAASIALERAQLAGIYAVYAKPWLLNGAFGSLTTQGEARGEIDIENHALARISMSVVNASISDAQERFAFAGLNGDVHWRNVSTERPRSVVGWRAARLLGVEIGSTQLHFATVQRDFALLQPVRVPVLDGAINLAEFQVRDAARDSMTLQVDGEIEPISVQRLCDAFGWPRFGGSLGGRVRDLRLRDGVLTLGTTLQAGIFDGQVRIADLQLEQPFSQWPRLQASIAIDNVDLEQVTTAFSFGRITGRLSGTIDNLRMFNWMPVAFDARFYTPADDRSRHRISQRAVDSIGRLGGGGGVTAALSTGLLNFFEEFNYERLGINCRLANEVCVMSGIEPARTGYYLVKGRGVPRIDVIGNAQRVDWPRMVEQLKSVTRAPEVEVQ